MNRTRQTAALLAAAAALGISAGITRAVAPTILNLGTLGGSESQGYSVNNNGQVTGSSRNAGIPGFPLSQQNHAFRYSNGAMVDLGTLGGIYSSGNAINAAGQIAGYSYIVPGQSDFTTHAFRYTGTPGAGGVMADVGAMGGTDSYGYGINASGQIVGRSTIGLGKVTHAFRYTGAPGSGGFFEELGTLGGSYSAAYAINDAGQVAGEGNLAGDAVHHASLYTGSPGAGDSMADLGTLGGANSTAYALNATGQVTGIADNPGGYFHAFLYSGIPGNGGKMADLGTFPGTYAPYTNSYGYAINANGQVAGASEIPGGNVRAFLYIGTPGSSGRMINLDSWLDATNPTEGAKWTLSVARGLSDNGWITGVGTYNDGPGGQSDGTRAFLLNAGALLSPQWNVDADGVWGAAANWTPKVVPDGNSAIAFFFGAITADREIALDSNRTVKEMHFDSPHRYIITSFGGNLTVGDGVSGEIEVASGLHEITANLTFDGNISKTGPGTLVISSRQNHAWPSSFTVRDGLVRLISDAGSRPWEGRAAFAPLALTVSGSGRVQLVESDQDLGELNINTDDPGPQQFDLASGFSPWELHSVRVYSADLLAAKANLWRALQNAHAPGAPDPTDGIYDSGLHANSAVGLALTLDVDGNPMVLIRSTRIGDLNLDGNVSISDFMDLSANFGGAGTWQEGDLNYDGMITISDFMDLSANFGASYAGDARPVSAHDQQVLAAFAASVGAAPVPEPGMLLLAASLAPLALRRRRSCRVARRN